MPQTIAPAPNRRSPHHYFVASILILLAASFSCAMAVDAPAPPRQQLSMDFNWKFSLTDLSTAKTADFNDADWQTLNLPHDWSIKGPISQDAPTGGGGGYFPAGIGWYRKSFRAPQSWQGKKISIQFDGVYENSEVFLNGQSLGKRPYGYISFSYDVTPYLKFADQENILAVRVDASLQPGSRYYSGCGIYRDVWLTVTNPLHVAHWGTFVTLPAVSPDSATVKIQTTIANDTADSAPCMLACSILDDKGNSIASNHTDQTIAANTQTEIFPQIKIPNPTLWTLDRPYLYTVRCQIIQAGQVLDQYDTPLGIRTAIFDVNKGFLLNNEPIKINGVCLHQDGGAVGFAVPIAIWEHRLNLLKRMGCNAIRISHNPPSPAFLDLCDRLGFLVMDEAFDEWIGGKVRQGYHLYFNDWSERDVIDQVRRDRNHPCVVIWSCGNEIGEQTVPNGVDVVRRLVGIFHSQDPTRPVTAACDKVYAEPRSAPPEFMAALDIAGYNYVDRWRTRTETYYESDKETFPDRKFIGTESPSIGGTRGDYNYLFGSPAPVPTQPTTTQRITPGRGVGAARIFGLARIIDVEQLWQFVRTRPYVSGEFMWTGIDYLGESYWPLRVATFGVIDTTNVPKDGYYFYQSQWTTQPMLHLFPHWNFPGKEGQFIPILCYTNCDTVELFLNNKSVGVKGYEFPRQGMEERYGNSSPRALARRTTADLHLQWDVPYEPGTLRAVGTKDGQVVATQEISTAGPPAVLALNTDRSTISADQHDVALISLQILDDQAHLVPIADNQVTFEIQGPANLLATDNGNPTSHESFQSNHQLAFNGTALAIIQSTDHPGPIRLIVHSPGLKDATIDLTAKPADPIAAFP
jgi:beta-galactosidase